MTIEVFSKEGCAICTAAKDKLGKLGLAFDSFDIDRTFQPHEGWREDGSVEILATYAMIDNHLPVIRIDGECTDYAGAMLRLKRDERAGAEKAGGERVH